MLNYIKKEKINQKEWEETRFFDPAVNAEKKKSQRDADKLKTNQTWSDDHYLELETDPNNRTDKEVLNAVLKKIGNQYKFLKVLAEGGYSKIYLVRHNMLGIDRVVKIMDSEFLFLKLKKLDFESKVKRYNEVKERFIREARLCSTITHPNIVKIYDVAAVKKRNHIEVPYLLMSYIKGISLADLMKREGRLDLNTAFRVSENILSTLQVLHDDKIIHRDISPANIILEDKSKQPILIDFGLAKDKLEQVELTKTGVSMGTPRYMSPEQYRDIKNIDTLSDIYSFGVVLYEMLTGGVPFMHAHPCKPVPDIIEDNPTLPRAIGPVISKAMAKQPKDRYRSAGEFLSALGKIIPGIKSIKPAEKQLTLKITAGAKQHDTAATEKIPWTKRKHLMYIYIFLLALPPLIIAAWFIFKAGASHYRELINSANKYIEKQDYEKAKNYLNQALEAKDTPEIRWLLEWVENRQIENMIKDFEAFEEFLAVNDSKKEVIQKCLDFLKKYQNIPKMTKQGK